MGLSCEKTEIKVEETKKAKKKLSRSEFHKIPDSLDINPENIANKNMLELHNKFRRIHQVDNLKKNNELNIKAKKYAQMLLEQNSHLKENNLYNNEIIGENIYISDIKLGQEFIIVLTSNGDVYTCGINDKNKLGIDEKLIKKNNFNEQKNLENVNFKELKELYLRGNEISDIKVLENVNFNVSS